MDSAFREFHLVDTEDAFASQVGAVRSNDNRPVSPKMNRSSASRTRSTVISVLMILCCLGAIAGQIWGISSLIAIHQEHSAWSSSEEERKGQIEALQESKKTAQLELSQHSTRLGELKAQIESALSELDRVNTDLSKAGKSVSLAREAEAAAVKSQNAAKMESERAISAQTTAEKKTADLTAEHEKLETKISQSHESYESVLKLEQEQKFRLETVRSDLASAQKELVAVSDEFKSSQEKLTELREQIRTESAKLEAALVENGKLVRKHEEILVRSAAADQSLMSAKNQEESLQAELVNLQKSTAALAMQKAQLTASMTATQDSANALQKQVVERTTELTRLNNEVKKLQDEERRLRSVIKELSSQAVPVVPDPQPSSTDN